MKKYYSIVLLWGLSLGAQVGINTPIPNSTLAVNGSLGANYKQVTTNTYSILANDHYLTYSGTGDATFTLPVIGTGTASYTGRIYKIKNISTSNITLQASSGNTLRIDNTPVSSFVIPLGAYAEVVNNSNATGGTWDLSFTVLPKPSNVEISVHSYLFRLMEMEVRELQTGLIIPILRTIREPEQISGGSSVSHLQRMLTRPVILMRAE